MYMLRQASQPNQARKPESSVQTCSQAQQATNASLSGITMYGRSVATLNMYVQTGAALPTTATWKRTGAQGRQWKSATVDVASKVVFNVSKVQLYFVHLFPV